MELQALIKIEKATYRKEYQIELEFSNGFKGIVDLKNELWGEVFKPLKDVGYFKNFKKDRWTIFWDCDAGFSPEFLYQLAVKQSEQKFEAV